MSIWNNQEIEYLRQHIGNTPKEAYDNFVKDFGPHRSYDSVQKKIKILREALSLGDTTDVSEEAVEHELAEIITTPGDPTVQLDPTIKADLKAERKIWLQDFIEEAKKHPVVEVTPPTLTKAGSSLVVQLSDLHIGQQNKHYDLKIAEERIQQIPNLLFQSTMGQNINEVVLMFIGDIVEGEDIFPTQPWHTICPVFDQVELAVKLLWKMILTTQSSFQCPVRCVCVPGNHGKVSVSSSEKTNWDNIVYHSLKLLVSMKQDPNVSIECDYLEFKSFQIKDKRGLINHQGVKHSGTPAMREKLASWVMNKKVDFIASGHWHEWKVGSWQSATFVANGCLCGANDLSERMAQEGPARQGYFLITEGKPLHGFSYMEWSNIERKI